MRRLLEPSKIPPIVLDFRRVLLTGIALWAGALVVVAVLASFGVDTGRGAAVCATGIALGGLALIWERHDRAHAHRTTSTPELPPRA